MQIKGIKCSRILFCVLWFYVRKDLLLLGEEISRKTEETTQEENHYRQKKLQSNCKESEKNEREGMYNLITFNVDVSISDFPSKIKLFLYFSTEERSWKAFGDTKGTFIYIF